MGCLEAILLGTFLLDALDEQWEIGWKEKSSTGWSWLDWNEV